MASETLRIIPLGGVGEVGKNMTAFELGEDIVVLDAGLAFPRDEHLGVALDELMSDTERLTRSLLGVGADDLVGGPGGMGGPGMMSSRRMSRPSRIPPGASSPDGGMTYSFGPGV